MLSSNVSDMEGLDFVALPKVMECKRSFIYLEKRTIFYQEKR